MTALAPGSTVSSFAVNDPAIHEPFLARVGDRHGFEIVVVLELRIHVLVPSELIHDEINIAMFRLRHVFHEQTPRHFAAFDEVLIHTEHITAPLRLVSTKTSRRMKNAGINEPARTDL